MKPFFLILVLLPAFSLADEDIKIDKDALNEKLKDKGVTVDSIEKVTAVEEENHVLVLTDDNFDDVINANEFILVEFYAPWCGHCKKLVPTYDELGEKMADEEVEIVKMDATANDVPAGFNVRGFPTLFWYPKDTKKAVSYDGGRELDDFVKYIAEKATDELKGFDRKGKAKKSEL